MVLDFPAEEDRLPGCLLSGVAVVTSMPIAELLKEEAFAVSLQEEA